MTRPASPEGARAAGPRPTGIGGEQSPDAIAGGAWLPFACGMLLALAAIVLAAGVARNERRQLAARLELEADARAAAIGQQLGPHFAAIERMAARWEARGGTPRPEWEQDASLYAEHDPAFRAIEWVGPAGGTRWTAPPEGSHGAAGGSDVEGRRDALERARRADTLVVSRPVDLAGGGVGLLAIVPLSVDGRPDGFFVAAFGVDDMFRQAADRLADEGYALTVLEGDRVLFRQGAAGEDLHHWAVDRTLTVAGTGYTLRSVPTAAHVDASLSSLPAVILGLGLVTAALVALTLRSRALHRARAAEARLANRALAHQIDERRAANLALAGARDMLASILDGASEGIIAVDGDGELVTWNPAAERILGPAVESPSRVGNARFGARAADGITPVPEEELPIARAARGEAVDDMLLLSRNARHPQGVWVAMSARPLRDPDGSPRGAVAVFRDVSERVRDRAAIEEAHAELREKAMALADANAELQRSNEELEQFAHIASHDLQEPIRTVASFTQLLADRYEGQLDDEADEFIRFIVGGALRMQRQIRDLLAYSRLQSGSRPFERTHLDAALDTALDRVATRMAESGARVERRPLPSVEGDPLQLALLFQHLLDNAVKFGSGVDRPPTIRVGAAWDEEEVVVWVADDGIGIDPRFSDRIFQIFQRVDPDESREGTGIGLAICKRVVERHGGRIWVESKPGEGARFVFTLRAAREAEDAGPAQAPVAAGALGTGSS